MWSNTIGEASRFHRSSAATIWSAVMLICTCQPSTFTRFDKGSIISIEVGRFFGSVRENRIPRMPPSARRFNSASVTVGRITATPRALLPSRAIASKVTRLSVT